MQPIDYLKKFDCKILYNHSSISNFKTGGKIKYLVYPQSFKSSILIFQELTKRGIDYIVVGKCCNILFRDSNYNGIVICMDNLKGLMVDEDRIYAYSGESMQNLVLFAKANSLSSLEGLYGIPGSVGGAIAMNAGAFSYTISDSLEYVDCMCDGVYERIKKEELNFTYRHSIFLDKKIVILGAQFKLKKESLVLIDLKMKECMEKRRLTQPSQTSLGCVFKKVNDVSAGYYIEKAGLKGFKIGGAQVSLKHANFIINLGNATSSDFIKLAKLVKSKVDKAFNVSLEYEVLLI